MRDPLDCPNCRAPMTAQMLDTVGLQRSVDVDRCDACSVFWFDSTEDLRLAPHAVIALFQAIGRAGKARNALASSCGCPRCGRTLLFTHDLQRATRFTYWRCRKATASSSPSISSSPRRTSCARPLRRSSSGCARPSGR